MIFGEKINLILKCEIQKNFVSNFMVIVTQIVKFE